MNFSIHSPHVGLIISRKSFFKSLVLRSSSSESEYSPIACCYLLPLANTQLLGVSLDFNAADQPNLRASQL
jgi:hypothetical protein